MVSAFFLQPLPVRNAHQLVFVLQRGDVINVPFGYSYPDYTDYRAGSDVFSELAAFMPMPVHLSARGHAAERTWVEVVSPNYFALADVRPAMGEFPRPGDPVGRGTAPSIVLSHSYWQRRFGGDRSLVGRAITLNGRTFTVTGVAPADFTGLSWAMAVSGWVPAGGMGTLMDGGDAFRENRGIPAFRVMGRLAPGKTIDDARAQVGVIVNRLIAEYPAEHKGTRSLVVPENRARPDPAVSEILPVFAVIFAAMVALVLLIACANVANLMISRATSRQRDLVIRAALGAGRMRLIRFQLVESLVFAAAASPRAYFYLPMVQHFQSSLTLIVRSASDLEALVAPLTQIVSGIDPGLPVYNVRSMDEHIRSSVFGLMPMRAGATIAGIQGFVGLLLAVMGLYAVVSYAVSRRTREIGIRMALGAERFDVLRLVVREGMRLSLVGIAIGLVIAAMLGLILSKVLYGLAPVDGTVFAGVTLLLVSVCALACYVPARRATRVDPLLALRHE